MMRARPLLLSIAGLLVIFLLGSCSPSAGEAGSDGVDLTEASYLLSPADGHCRAICYGAGRVVAAGGESSGVVLYKALGEDWSSVAVGSARLNAVAYGNGTFVAGANDGAIYYSSDGGESWNAAASGVSVPIADIAYGEGRFVAVSYSLAAASSLLHSIDGTGSWGAYAVAGTPQFCSVDYANGSFFAGASGPELYSSADGISWLGPTSLTGIATNNPVGVAYGNGRYLLLDEGGFLGKSADGATWSAAEILDPSMPACEGLVFDGSSFVFITQAGTLFSTTDGELWSFEQELPDVGGVFTYYDLFWAPGLGGGSYLVAREGPLS
ncbi:MAG TPA: hypothetical protein P5142_01965 [Spirochaetia bacterium]|nr:hypothetical protein [Spirochaetia bacterium]